MKKEAWATLGFPVRRAPRDHQESSVPWDRPVAGVNVAWQETPEPSDPKESGVNPEHQDSQAGQVHRENRVSMVCLESREYQAATEARAPSVPMVPPVAGARQDRAVPAETMDPRDCLEMAE